MGLDKASQDERIRLETRLTIGRHPGNDVHVESPQVSARHAEVVAVGGRVELRDLGSRHGTRLNGVLVRRAELRPGSEIGVGPVRLVFDGEEFVRRDEQGGLRLQARAVSVSARRRVLLRPSSLDIVSGEFVALIGPSGSGKSTLLKALAGMREATGTILLNGEPIRTRLPEIGYLPQDEIVHPRLTVLESLGYSARLRLPPDVGEDEVEAGVQRALTAVALEDVQGTLVGNLSGGQRKRVGLATELLDNPGILFLDEPTTGLDPALETHTMELFRDLASSARHALVVVTHATRNLELADTVCVVGEGGELCFVGSPDEMRSFFGVSSADAVYDALEERPASEWRRDFDDVRPQLPPGAHAPPEHAYLPAPERPRQREALLLHTRVLVGRYLTVFLRDRRNLAILLLQAPVLALGIGLLFKPGILRPGTFGQPLNAAQLLFLLVSTTIWLGAIDASREIIKERAVLDRELAVGVTVRAYLASKLTVLSTLVVLQAGVLLFIVALLRPFHEPIGAYMNVFGLLALVGLVSVAVGLFISAAAATEDQATALTPIAMIFLLLFGGTVVPVKSMSAMMGAISTLAYSRWAFAGVGTVVNLDDRLASIPRLRLENPYGTSFFSVSPGLGYAILAGFLLFVVAITGAAVRRRRSA